MGLNRGELIALVRYILFVEGKADELVLNGLYGPFLNEAGIHILPLSGIQKVLSLAELRMIGRLFDAHAGVLADNTRPWAVRRESLPKDATREERALHDLYREQRKRDRRLDYWGLKQPDIIAYLDEEAVRSVATDFPGWTAVERYATEPVVTHQGRQERTSSFKIAANQLAGRPFDLNLIHQAVSHMQARNIAARGDLPHVLTQIITAAGSDEHPSP